jgi:hypothetical protein
VSAPSDHPRELYLDEPDAARIHRLTKELCEKQEEKSMRGERQGE